MNYLSFFEESVHKNYDKIALVDQDGTRKFTYNELDELSGRVATRLTQEGVCAGDSVMIHMGRKSEYFVAYLGILKMGGVVVPVIEEYPTDRIEYIEKDSQAKKIIRDDFFQGIFDGTSLSVFMDEIAAVYQGKQPKEEKLSLFDISVFEEALKETEAYKEAQTYFEKKLNGIDVDSSLIAVFTPEKPVGSAKQLLISTHE